MDFKIAMTGDTPLPPSLVAANLRRLAKERLYMGSPPTDLAPLSPEEVLHLMHELQVKQIDAGLKAEIEAAMGETKAAIEGGDPEAMKEKANALAQVAMKMGQAIYEQEQAAGTSAAPSEEAAADDDVVDAEFSEVDEDKKD